MINGLETHPSIAVDEFTFLINVELGKIFEHSYKTHAGQINGT